MQVIYSNDARMKIYDFINRAVYRDTYSAYEGVRKLALDCFRFSERPGSDWDACQVLKMSLAMNSIPHFLMNF